MNLNLQSKSLLICILIATTRFYISAPANNTTEVTEEEATDTLTTNEPTTSTIEETTLEEAISQPPTTSTIEETTLEEAISQPPTTSTIEETTLEEAISQQPTTKTSPTTTTSYNLTSSLLQNRNNLLSVCSSLLVLILVFKFFQ